MTTQVYSMCTTVNLVLLYIILCLLTVIYGQTAQQCVVAGCRCQRSKGKLSVDCSGIKLPSIPEGIPEDVHSLDLSDNAIVALRYGELSALNQLQTLKLTRNSIAYIDTNVFRNLTALKTLSLDGNSIGNIQYNTFEHLTAVEIINLENNDIEFLKASSFKLLPSLKEIKLKSNKLKCHCDSLRLKLWARSAKVKLKNARCVNLGNTNIDQLNDQKIKDCRVEPFQCATCTGSVARKSCGISWQHSEACPETQATCFTRLTFENGVQKVTKGCESLNKCLTIEGDSDRNCQPGRDVNCTFCCAESNCNRRQTVRGYNFNLPLQLGFIVTKMYKPMLGIPNTEQYRVQVAKLTSMIEPFLERSVGGKHSLSNFYFGVSDQDSYIITNLTLTSEVVFGEHIPDYRDVIYEDLKRGARTGQLTDINPASITLVGQGFCSAETEEIKGKKYLWQTTEVGSSQRRPCPGVVGPASRIYLIKRCLPGDVNEPALWDETNTGLCFPSSSSTGTTHLPKTAGTKQPFTATSGVIESSTETHSVGRTSTLATQNTRGVVASTTRDGKTEIKTPLTVTEGSTVTYSQTVTTVASVASSQRFTTTGTQKRVFVTSSQQSKTTSQYLNTTLNPSGNNSTHNKLTSATTGTSVGNRETQTEAVTKTRDTSIGTTTTLKSNTDTTGTSVGNRETQTEAVTKTLDTTTGTTTTLKSDTVTVSGTTSKHGAFGSSPVAESVTNGVTTPSAESVTNGIATPSASTKRQATISSQPSHTKRPESTVGHVTTEIPQLKTKTQNETVTYKSVDLKTETGITRTVAPIGDKTTTQKPEKTSTSSISGGTTGGDISEGSTSIKIVPTRSSEVSEKNTEVTKRQLENNTLTTPVSKNTGTENLNIISSTIEPESKVTEPTNNSPVLEKSTTKTVIEITIKQEETSKPTEEVTETTKHVTKYVTERSTDGPGGRCSAEATIDSRGRIQWPSTRVGTRVERQCPRNMERRRANRKYYAYRMCMWRKQKATWSLPDTSNCPFANSDMSLEELANMPVTADTIGPLTKEMAKITENAANFSQNDVRFIGLTVNNVVVSGEALDTESSQNLVDSFGNLLATDSQVLLQSEAATGTTTKLVENIEKFTQQISLDKGESSRVFTHPKLAVAVAAVDSGSLEGLFFGLKEERHDGRDGGPSSGHAGLKAAEIQVSQKADNNTDTSVQIPREVLLRGTSGAKAHFIVYSSDNFFQILKKSSSSKNRSSAKSEVTTQSGQKAVIDIVPPTEPPYKRQVNSRVIAVGIPGTPITNLKTPVLHTLKHTIDENVRNATCVFWDFATKGWSTEGVKLRMTGNKKTVCESNHLTNFALLMDVYGSHRKIDGTHEFALSVITYIGCGVSMVALSLTLLSYSLFSKLRKENPSKILVNLCIVLFLVCLSFVVNTILANWINIVACKIMAGLLHYFLLATMCWMLLESFYLYLALVKVFQTYYSRFIAKCALFGWGAPLIIVGVTIAINRDNYTRQNGICWLAREAFYGAFLAPVALVLTLNVIAFCVVIRQLRSVAAKKLEKTKRHGLSVQIRGAIGITVLLGLTWAFAFFAIGSASLVFSYLFAIFNSLQGLFIFVFYCLLKRDVQRAYMRCLPFCPTPTDDTRTTSKSGKGTTSSNLSGQTKRLTANNASPSHQPILISNTPIPDINLYQHSPNGSLAGQDATPSDDPTRKFTTSNNCTEV